MRISPRSKANSRRVTSDSFDVRLVLNPLSFVGKFSPPKDSSQTFPAPLVSTVHSIGSNCSISLAILTTPRSKDAGIPRREFQHF